MTPPQLAASRGQWFLAFLIALWSVYAFKGFFLPIQSSAQFWTVDLFYYVALPTLALAIASWILQRPLSELVHPRIGTGPAASVDLQVALGFVLVIAHFGLLFPIRSWASASPEVFTTFMPMQLNYTQIANDLGPYKILGVLYFAATAALVEEYFFRGFFARFFLERASPASWRYVTVSAALFAVYHWHIGIGTVLLSLGTGVLAAVVVLKTRTLLPVVGAHFVIDVISFT